MLEEDEIVGEEGGAVLLGKLVTTNKAEEGVFGGGSTPSLLTTGFAVELRPLPCRL